MLVNDIRHTLARQYQRGQIRNGTVEIQGASFLADEDVIFGKRNEEYIKAEIAWYESENYNVNALFDIYGKEVKIWQDISDQNGFVNSQYGALVYGDENHEQYNNCFNALAHDRNTRQAVMIYTRPEMHYEATDNGRKDFTCTNVVQYFINGRWLDAVVQMRSNDVVFGYTNDYAWQKHVLSELTDNLNEDFYGDLEVGSIRWQVGSLHVYERHFNLLEDYIERMKL